MSKTFTIVDVIAVSNENTSKIPGQDVSIGYTLFLDSNGNIALALNDTHLNSYSASTDPLATGPEPPMNYPLDNPLIWCRFDAALLNALVPWCACLSSGTLEILRFYEITIAAYSETQNCIQSNKIECKYEHWAANSRLWYRRNSKASSANRTYQSRGVHRVSFNTSIQSTLIKWLIGSPSEGPPFNKLGDWSIDWKWKGYV